MPAAASAHGELISSDPAANVSLLESPEVITLTFSESIDPSTAMLELLDELQAPIGGLGPIEISDDGIVLRVTLPDLEPGVYTVSYQILSRVDGHVTAGIFAFLVDPTGAQPPPTTGPTATSPSVDGFTVAARWVALAAVLVALGSLIAWLNAGRSELARVGVDASPPWRLVGAAAVAGAVGVAGYLALAARPVVAAGGPSGFPLDIAAPFGWTPFAIALRVAFGASLAAALVALIGSRRAEARWPAMAGALLLGVALLGMSWAAHASASGGPAFAAIDWVHLLGVATWLGSLPAIFLLARRARPATADVRGAMLRRHGRIAIVAAPIVALTGIANSPLVLGASRDLVASDYGNLLVAKSLLLAGAVGIGAVNHLALRSRTRAPVATLVGAELAVAALAVLVAATMVTIQPASARQPVLAAPPIRTAHFYAELGPSQVHAAVNLPAPGTQSYLVSVVDLESGVPRSDVQKVFVDFAPPASTDLPPERVELAYDPVQAIWSARGAYTPLVGEWTLEVIVRRAATLDESFEFAVDVATPATPELAPPPDTGIGVPAPLGAAWSLLPDGPAGSLPAILALVAVAVAGWVPRSAARDAVRAAAVVLLVVAGAAVGTRTLVAAANTPTAAELAAQPTLTAVADAERGAGVFLANCAACHGRDGTGGGVVVTLPAAGSLADAVRNASDAELSYRIAYGVAGTAMPAYAGSLTRVERSDLIAFLRERFGGPPPR